MRFLQKPLMIFLLCMVHLFTNAQNIDSLKTELTKANIENTPQQFTLLHQLANAYLYVNLDSAKYYAETMIEGVKKTDDKLKLAKGYNKLADILNLQGRYQDAMNPLEKSIEICRELKNNKALSRSTFLKGNILQNLNQYTEAEKSYLESYEVAQNNKDTLMMAKNYQGLGLNSDYQGNMDDAIDYYFKAVNYFTIVDNLYGLGTCYTNLGIIYNVIKQSEKSIDYYKKGIAIKKELKNYRGLAITYYNLAEMLIGHKKFEEGAPLIDSTLHYALISNNTFILPHAYYTKGNLLLETKRNHQAKEVYLEGIKIANQLNEPHQIARGKFSLGKVYSELGNFQKAANYFEEGLSFAEKSKSIDLERKFILPYIKAARDHKSHKKLNQLYERLLVINDSLFSQQKITAISEVEAKYQNEKKEKENQVLKSKQEIQKSTIQNQNIILFGSLFGMGLLALMAFMFYRQNQHQRKSNQLLSEKNNKIELLHKELSHRVKNNLAFISSLMQMQGHRLESVEAKQAVKEGENRIKAISLLHRKLYLQNEVEAIDAGIYLKELCGNLQQTYPFMSSHPTINIQADELRIDGEDTMRIGLIINELVTNSFKYAFENQEHPEINIQLKKNKNDGYQLTYHDNGKGLPKTIDIAQTESLGLKLINMLTQQLDGTLQTRNGVGTTFIFDFNHSKS